MKAKHLVVIGDSRKMPEVKDNSTHLIVTSPPYYNVKDYGRDRANIGGIDCYEQYLIAMQEVFNECYRVLDKGRYVCINVSDVISSGEKYPIPFHFVPMLERAGFKYRDDIIWKKPNGVGANATGGAAKRFGVFMQNPFPMYYYPNNIYEHVLVFRKGNFDFKSVSKEEKERCRFDLNFALEHFNSDIWEMVPASRNQYSGDSHPAMFPEELPESLIQLYTFLGETILDPFLGSGTTMKAADGCGRNCVGYEVNEAYLQLIERKVGFSNFRLIKRGGKNERD
jgi:site-specific DNA-methyltransferase (adenine-specific)